MTNGHAKTTRAWVTAPQSVPWARLLPTERDSVIDAIEDVVTKNRALCTSKRSGPFHEPSSCERCAQTATLRTAADALRAIRDTGAP